MSDTLIVVLAIAAAIGLGMAIWSWRIKRLQYPPELRWPDEHKSRRSSTREKEESARD